MSKNQLLFSLSASIAKLTFASFMLSLLFQLSQLQHIQCNSRLTKQFYILPPEIIVKDLTREEFLSSAIHIKENPLFDIRIFSSQKFQKCLYGRRGQYRLLAVKEQLDETIDFLLSFPQVKKKLLSLYTEKSRKKLKVDVILHTQKHPAGLVTRFSRSPEKNKLNHYPIDILAPKVKNRFTIKFKGEKQADRNFTGHCIIFFSPQYSRYDYPFEFYLMRYQFAHELFHVIQKLFGVSLDSPNFDGIPHRDNFLVNPTFIEGTPEVISKYLLERARKKSPRNYRKIQLTSYSLKKIRYPIKFPDEMAGRQQRSMPITYNTYPIWYSGNDFQSDFQQIVTLYETHYRERQGSINRKSEIQEQPFYQQILRRFAKSVFEIPGIHRLKGVDFKKINPYGIKEIDLSRNPYSELSNFTLSPQTIVRYAIKIPFDATIMVKKQADRSSYSIQYYPDQPGDKEHKNVFPGPGILSLICLNSSTHRLRYVSDFLSHWRTPWYLLPYAFPQAPLFTFIPTVPPPRKITPYLFHSSKTDETDKLETDFPQVLSLSGENRLIFYLPPLETHKNYQMDFSLKSCQNHPFGVYILGHPSENRKTGSRPFKNSIRLSSIDRQIELVVRPTSKGSFLVTWRLGVISKNGKLIWLFPAAGQTRYPEQIDASGISSHRAFLITER